MRTIIHISKSGFRSKRVINDSDLSKTMIYSLSATISGKPVSFDLRGVKNCNREIRTRPHYFRKYN